MDISIIISGNLTGFSRFYASPNANDIYNEAKFDFDYRNFLTFINAGEKVYAVSFSPNVIAVSLITRILDSFRRPGILVVTALIRRRQLVTGTLNAQDKSAIYRLLNEINDKFYEKNFLNDMVNQNPAVLMQDYYSDILRNYSLATDRMQKAVNASIDVNAPNKRVGYVAANEKDMPKYLSSLMRKSYNGYHHVFFADNAPANIDEPAEEIVTYRARIVNGNRTVPGEVRLTDKIPTVVPDQGERPLTNTNFTYGQVLNGEAGADIIATIENDTIVLKFNFPKEEKTITFKFFDGADELPIQVLRPSIVESNGNAMPISTDTITFYGKEIYGSKSIRIGNPDYTVESSSSVIDLQRPHNGSTINVYVRKGWKFFVNFGKYKRPKTIILTNRYTHEQLHFDNVREKISQLVPGNRSEWDVEIISDYYETAKFPAAVNQSFDLIEKKQAPVSKFQDKATQVKKILNGGNGTKTAGNSGGQTTLTGGANDVAEEQKRIEAEKKRRYTQYGILALAAIFCLIIGGYAYNHLFNKGDLEKKTVTFTFVSFDDYEIKDEQLLKLLDFQVEPSSEAVKIGGTDQFGKVEISYEKDNKKDKGKNGKSDYVTATVSLKESKEVLCTEKIYISDLKDPYELKLNISKGKLRTYLPPHSEDIGEDHGDDDIADIGAEEPSKGGETPERNLQQKEEKQSETEVKPKEPYFNIEWGITDVNKAIEDTGDENYKKQLKAIKACLVQLKGGQVKKIKKLTINNLPAKFAIVIRELRALQNRIDAITDQATRDKLQKAFEKHVKDKSNNVHLEKDVYAPKSETVKKIKEAEEAQNQK